MKKLQVESWSNNAYISYCNKKASRHENMQFVKFMIGALLVLLFVGFLESTL